MASGKYGIMFLPSRGIAQRRSATRAPWRCQRHCRFFSARVAGGMGLVSFLMPTLYDYAGCCNAINSSPQSGLLLNDFLSTLLELNQKNKRLAFIFAL
ncbi:MAG: hypothetical protein KAT56_08100 [Sedimentisphaerales bacterium]|nr:hypothetical protein [Sedimentisphaerales bacterium]